MRQKYVNHNVPIALQQSGGLLPGLDCPVRGLRALSVWVPVSPATAAITKSLTRNFKMPKKRGNHEGSIYRRASDGRWVAAISVEDALSGESLRKTKIARSREHARLLLRELQAKYGTHAAVPRKSSLQRIVDSWLASPAVKNLAEATQASYQDTMARHVLPYLGKREVSEINALSIREWHQRMNLAGVGLRSMENAHAVLSSCLSDAMRLGMVTGNPCRSVPRPRPETEEIWPFSAEEQARILKAAEGHRLYAAFLLGLRIGLRQGELFGLTWDSVDLTEGTIRIDQQASEVRGKIIVKRPKTRASRRMIKLDDVCVAALKQRRRTAMAEGQAGNEYVFPSERGTVMRRTNFGQRHWKPLLEKLGITHRGFHHARHTAATTMLLSGEPVQQVAGILGHANASMTLDVYAHYIPRVAVSVAVSPRVRESESS
jgi:integrase